MNIKYMIEEKIQEAMETTWFEDMLESTLERVKIEEIIREKMEDNKNLLLDKVSIAVSDMIDDAVYDALTDIDLTD